MFSVEDGIPFMSRWRRIYLDFRIWLGLKLFEQPRLIAPLPGCRPGPSTVINLGFGQILKGHSSPNELAMLEWLRKKTKIPVPRVHGAWARHGDFRSKVYNVQDPIACCVVMDRVPGVPFGQVIATMGGANIKKICRQLSWYIKVLRSCPEPVDYRNQVCSFIGGAMEDAALSEFDAVGPFSKEEFVEYLMKTYIENRAEREDHLREILWRELKDPKKLYLTHGDLHLYNIMVDKTGKNGEYKVTGIIDWTTAGWMPIYWEGYKAGFMPRLEQGWREIAPIVTGGYEEEIAVVRELVAGIFR